ncbi:Protein SDS23 [Pseudozyma hubeiensis]|nr:Protein SDS23 [Pseudozyma hubeiensis]
MALPQTRPISIPTSTSSGRLPRSHFRSSSVGGSDPAISLPRSALSVISFARQDPFADLGLQQRLECFSAQDVLSCGIDSHSRLVVLPEHVSIEAAGERLAEADGAETWIVLQSTAGTATSSDRVGKLQRSGCAGILSLEDLAAFFAAVFGPHHPKDVPTSCSSGFHGLGSPPASPSTASSCFRSPLSALQRRLDDQVETIRSHIASQKPVAAGLVSDLSRKNKLRHVSLDCSLGDIIRELSEDEVNCLVVSDLRNDRDGAVCGILTAADVVAFLAVEAEKDGALASIFSKTLDMLSPSVLQLPAAVISGDKSTVDALVRMQAEQLSVLAVTDPLGGLVSPISCREIAQEILRSSSRKILTTPLTSLVKDLRSRHPQGTDGKDAHPAVSVGNSSTIGRAAALLLASDVGGVLVIDEPRVVMTPPLSCISTSPGKELPAFSLDADAMPLSRSVSFTPAPAQKHRRSSTQYWTAPRGAFGAVASGATSRPSLPNFALDTANDYKPSVKPDQPLSSSVSSLPVKSTGNTVPALLRTPSGPRTHRPRSLSLAQFTRDESMRHFGAQAAFRTQGSWTPSTMSPGSSVSSSDSPTSPFGNMLVSGFFGEVMQNALGSEQDSIMSLHPRQSLHPAAMGHNAAMPTQQQSVTEQIMQLDQAITLTLQEIDQNFATAHQIVTSRILPAVKEYGVASARVWQGAKFWKTFYEVSANVSLTAHVQNEGEFDANSQGGDVTQSGNDSRENATFARDDEGRSPRSETGSIIYNEMDASIVSGDGDDDVHDAADESVEQAPADRARAASPPRFSNASMAAAARREAAQRKQQKPRDREDQENVFDPAESPFERLRRDITTGLGKGLSDPSMDQSSFVSSGKVKPSFGTASTERDRAALAQGIENLGSTHTGRGGRSIDPDSSNASSVHDLPQFKSSATSAGRMKTSSTPKKGALLNKVLDSEHKRNKGRLSYTKIQATPRSSQSKSNPFAPPSVRMWDGIVDLRKTPLTSKIKGTKSTKTSSSNKRGGASKKDAQGEDEGEWDSDSSDKDSLGWPAGMSPPVTMQFSVPQSRYAQTPAKEAAKMMVDDLLRSVGASSPAARAWPKSASKNRAGQAVAEHAASSRKQPVATPLRMGRKEAKQRDRQSGAGRRRNSIPTPPTLTKRGPSLSQEDTLNSSNAPSANASSAAMLMDADEGLDLNAADAPGLSSSTVSSFNQPKQAGRSIEDDTLFGVRSNAAPRAAETQSSRDASHAGVSSGQGKARVANGDDARGEESFKVWGHVDEMGTVHGGRPLVDRDDTYSAPSPTPFNMNPGAPARR